jgi:Spy/CpxP family protein refolding chaperone
MMTLSSGLKIGAGALFLAGIVGTSLAMAHPRFGRGPWLYRGRLAAELQLSDDQKAQISSIFAAARDKMHAMRRELREKHMALRDAAQNEPFDETVVRSKAQELADYQAEMMVARAKLMTEAFAVLTSDQKAKLQELRAERQKRFMEWQQRRSANPSGS